MRRKLDPGLRDYLLFAACALLLAWLARGVVTHDWSLEGFTYSSTDGGPEEWP